MKTLFIISGHSSTTDPGAVSNVNGRTYREADLTIEFRDLLIEECRKLGMSPKTDANQNALQATLNWFRGLVFSPDSLMIDIHFNAGPATANGTEVVIPNNATRKERAIANDMLDVMAKYWRRRRVLTEGETPRKRLGIFRTNKEQVLLELCFITNSSDMTTYERVKRSVAKELALVIHKHFVGDTQKVHVVKPGDNLWRIAIANNTTMEALMIKNNLPNNTIRVGQRIIL